MVTGIILWELKPSRCTGPPVLPLSGLINRVAGVFARRGANIESLAVGLNADKALFTIVVTGTPSTVENLVKQLRKLVKVRYVEDVTNSHRVERELVMIKVRAPTGSIRADVMQIAEIFRARVVDVSDRCLTMAVTGDPGKVTAFQNALAKFEARKKSPGKKKGKTAVPDRDPPPIVCGISPGTLLPTTCPPPPPPSGGRAVAHGQDCAQAGRESLGAGQHCGGRHDAGAADRAPHLGRHAGAGVLERGQRCVQLGREDQCAQLQVIPEPLVNAPESRSTACACFTGPTGISLLTPVLARPPCPPLQVRREQ